MRNQLSLTVPPNPAMVCVNAFLPGSFLPSHPHTSTTCVLYKPRASVARFGRLRGLAYAVAQCLKCPTKKKKRYIQGTIWAHQDQYPISAISTCAIYTFTEPLDTLTALKTCRNLHEPLTVSDTQGNKVNGCGVGSSRVPLIDSAATELPQSTS